MNKRIDFSKNGGFPATQYMTDFMQKSYREAFAALASLIGDKVVVQGMSEVGGSVLNGWLSYQGELIEFAGGPLGDNPYISISETKESRLFNDGSTNDVYFVKKAAISNGAGAFAYSELKRIDTLQATFESLANLIAAFNAHTHTFASITGKPIYYVVDKGSFNLGDVNSTDITRTVPLPNAQPNANYYVIASWVGNDANWNINNDVLPPLIFNKTANSFDIGIREIATNTQNIRLEFVIINTL